MGELAAVGVDEHGNKAVLFSRQLVNQPHHLIYNLLESKKKKMTSKTRHEIMILLASVHLPLVFGLIG